VFAAVRWASKTGLRPARSSIGAYPVRGERAPDGEPGHVTGPALPRPATPHRSRVLIVLGIAITSRIAAVFASIGSAVGMLTGLALGDSGVAIYNGLGGFNSFDACLTIGGVFYVLSVRSAVLAGACLNSSRWSRRTLTTREGNLRGHHEQAAQPARDTPGPVPQ
jgi:hypothetical protein